MMTRHHGPFLHCLSPTTVASVRTDVPSDEGGLRRSIVKPLGIGATPLVTVHTKPQPAGWHKIHGTSTGWQLGWYALLAIELSCKIVDRCVAAALSKLLHLPYFAEIGSICSKQKLL